MSKPRKRRLTFAEHTDEEYRNAWRAIVVEGSLIWDFLSEVAAQDIDADSEWQRAQLNGERNFANRLLAMAMSEAREVTVKKNLG